MVDGISCRRPQRRRLVEPVVEDRSNRPVGTRADLECTAAGRVDPLPAEAFDQADDAQAGAESLLGMRAIGENALAQQRGIGTDGGGFPGDPLDRPVGKAPMGRRHVLGDRRMPAIAAAAHVGGDPLALVEQLDGVCANPGLDLLAVAAGWKLPRSAV